jgi:hypothetical protein
MQVAADPEYFNKHLHTPTPPVRQTYELLKRRKTKTEMEELQLVGAKILYSNNIFCCAKFVVLWENAEDENLNQKRSRILKLYFNIFNSVF